MLTYGTPPEFRGSVHLFIYNRHTPSGQSRVYRVTQLRTDGVHCREPGGTGPVNLKVVPNQCCLGTSPWTKICASLSHTCYWYEVGILKVPLYIIDSMGSVESVPTFSSHAINACRWRSPPRVHRHRARSPQGSSSKGCCLFR